MLENPEQITKAVGGISWTPHALDVPQLLEAAGFARIEVLVPPSLRHAQAPVLEQRNRSFTARAGRAIAPGAVLHAWRDPKARRDERETQALKAVRRNPAYYTYLAYVDQR